MSVKLLQPRLGKAVQAAMKEKGLSPLRLTQAMGLDPKDRAAVYHWIKGHNAPNPENRTKLNAVLGIDVDRYIDAGKAAGRPKKQLGPARRAVALAQAAVPELVTTILPPAPPVSDVFTFRARSDGTVSIKLDTVLPYERGVQLINALLGFGLVIGADPASTPPGVSHRA